MKYCKIVLLFLFILLALSCSKFDDKSGLDKEKYEKYYENIKVNNDLTFSGVMEIKKENLEDKEYFHFFYDNNELVKIESHSDLSNSFYELNKYIFNVNKDFREINILRKANYLEYIFLNNKDLIKFSILYSENNEPKSFNVIPFKINYDNFNVLGNSVVYSGAIEYKDNKIKSIDWSESNAKFNFSYDNKNNLTSKQIFNNNKLLYEYNFKLSTEGIVVGIR